MILVSFCIVQVLFFHSQNERRAERAKGPSVVKGPDYGLASEGMVVQGSIELDPRNVLRLTDIFMDLTNIHRAFFSA